MSNDADQHGQTGTGCTTCDLGDVGAIACKAKRYAKQAEVMTQVAADLDGYKKKFDGVCQTLSDAWAATGAEIDGTRKALDDLKRKFDCEKPDPGMVTCLEKAAQEAFQAVDACRPSTGCCVGNCEFSNEVGEDDDATTIGSRIDAYRRDTTANVACFLSLLDEVKTRDDQVAKIKVEVTALAAEWPTVDDKTRPKWHARWLIANHGLELSRLGHGFATAAAYRDCLCKALQCIAAGWDKIAVLEGVRAELVCLEEAATAECERKTTGVLVTILDAYECCMDDAGSPTQPPPPEDCEKGAEQAAAG
ncbi:hypothetical protein AB4Y83_19840 [Terrabacter sp. RAF57]